MEDKNKNQFNNGQNDAGQNNHTANPASNEQSSEQSHYYSYGPFQSLNKDNNNEQSSTSSDHQVEVTPPAPVRPIYSADSNNAMQSSSQNDHLNNLQNTGNGNGNGGYNGYNGNGYGGNDGNNRKPQFQYNKPKSPVKTVVASVLAGMILMTGGMYGADRANLFTGGEAAATTTGTASTTNATPTESNTVTQAALPAGSADVADVVKTASPAVVKIETYTNSSSGGGNSTPNYSDPMYRFFFGDQFGGGDGGSGGSGSGNGGGSGSGSSGSLTPLGIGSGFIFDKSGYILTNAHVVGDASTIQVTLEDNKTPYEAKLMGKSTDLDLAVLKIEPTEGQTDFPYISLGNSDNVAIGSWLVAIGNPQGFDHTVTAGVLSAKERSITASDASNGESTKYQHLLQTDASINPGNSGGPLLNMQGQVIGINTAVSEDAQGIGFAIPSNEVAKVVENLKNGKEIPATPVPFIGASLMTLTPEISKQLGIDTTSGSVVTEVLYRSPAYQADLRSYDVITGINGTTYTNSQDLIAAIQKLKVGDNATLNIIRDGKKMDLKVAIGDRNQYEKTVGTSGTESNQ